MSGAPDAHALLAALTVTPGSPADLAGRATRDRLGFATKSDGKAHRAELLDELRDLQRRLWADRSASLLVVLQGMDASGKDSTIRRVFGGLNPQGVRVANFAAPAGAESEHHYLWRISADLPRRGKIGVFNRSHYEDVTAVRVGELAPEAVWRRRYDHIRAFEQMLVDEGTSVVKVFLHISSDHQARRLQQRIDDPDRRWKFDRSDIEARSRWDAYAVAWEEAITETSTPAAPWLVVPAERRWARDVAVSEALRAALRAIDPAYPEPDPDVDFSSTEIPDAPEPNDT